MAGQPNHPLEGGAGHLYLKLNIKQFPNKVVINDSKKQLLLVEPHCNGFRNQAPKLSTVAKCP